MYKSETNYSIQYLKSKFDEIRRNINNIEKRQNDYLNYSGRRSYDIDSSFTTRELADEQRSFTYRSPNISYQAYKPQHTDRMDYSYTSQRSGDSSSQYFMKLIKELEWDKKQLTEQVNRVTSEREMLRKENAKLKSDNKTLISRLNELSASNKSGIDNISFDQSSNANFSQTQERPRPSSIIRSNNSSPKKHRVAFSSDLVKVVHISNDDYKNYREKQNSYGGQQLKNWSNGYKGYEDIENQWRPKQKRREKRTLRGSYSYGNRDDLYRRHIPLRTASASRLVQFKQVYYRR